jgi:lipopolysaccharide biosynthesis regulator YciM
LPDTAPLVIALLALVTVGVSAWLLGRRAGRRSTPPFSHDQVLQFLRGKRPGSREAAAMPSSDDPEVEFALGALFRRRGEFGLATELHARLETKVAPELRDRARFELALDFLSAGLMDRAERLLNELAATPGYRRLALERLVRLHERQGDWSNALSAWSRLPDAERETSRVAAAHYFCELADQALLQGDPERVENLLRQARAQDAAEARIRMLSGRLDEWRGRPLAALDHYAAAASQTTSLLPELLPRIVSLAASTGASAVPASVRQSLVSSGQISERQFALFADARGTSADGRALASRAQDDAARYVCGDCGLQSVAWDWHCPACFAWERFKSLLIRDETA